MIGSFGGIVFTTSAEKLRTFNGLNRQGAARYAEHALVGKKPKLEFIGPELDQISFSMRLDRFLGVSPDEEIRRIVEIKDSGEALPLTIGGNYLGMFVITSASEERKNHDNKGLLLVADVNLSLKEYADG